MSYPGVRAIPSCAECNLEAGGQCRACHRYLCVDHFGYQDHHPCREQLAMHEQGRVCYVCGEPVTPRQWSTSAFSHYSDACTCVGCHRFICAERHTSLLDEQTELVRDRLRSHRYHTTQRYCRVCAPLRHIGGLLGAARAASVVLAVGTGVALFLLHVR